MLLSPSSVNPQNIHSNLDFSSKVGAVVGCGGSDSVSALQQKGLYEVVKTGGKKIRKSKRTKKHKGGSGYGFSKEQSVNSNDPAHLPSYTSYKNEGVNSDTNMNASKQLGGSYGTGGYPYYSYKPSESENLSVFAGSGYPPITRGLNSQCGGRKRKTKKSRKSVMKSRKSVKKSRKSVKKSAKRRPKKSKFNKSKKMKSVINHKKYNKQHGGYSQYMSNVASTPSYSSGAPPSLSSNESALANPVPITPKNDCMSSWKHLGDAPPYNKSGN